MELYFIFPRAQKRRTHTGRHIRGTVFHNFDLCVMVV